MNLAYERLKSLHSVGGESLVNSPTIYGQFLLGADPLYIGTATAQLCGVDFHSSALVEGGCLTGPCLDGTGIWTTGIVTKYVRTEVDNLGNSYNQYWVDGSTDVDGNVWICDMGTLCPSTGDFNIIDTNLGINNDGTVTSLSILGIGTKIAIFKLVTSTSYQEVLYVYGDLPATGHLTRTSLGYTLRYNAIEQATNLEDIAISILNLLLCEYKDVRPNSQVYYLNGEIDPVVLSIVRDNLDRLETLLDTTSSTRRYGSIPINLTTYISGTDLYGPCADNERSNPIVYLVDPSCVDPSCFAQEPNLLITSRLVSTRAISWLVYAICILRQYWFISDYDDLLLSLSNYLYNQLDPVTSLPSRGWTDSPLLANSTEITTYDFSNAVITSIAMMKLAQVYNDEKYIDWAANIYNSILARFFSFNTHSFIAPEDDLVVSFYSLLFTTLYRREDITEGLINYLTTLYRVDYGIPKEVITLGSSSHPISTGTSVLYTVTTGLGESEVIANPGSLSYINTSVTDLNEISKYSTLLGLLLTNSSNNHFTITSKLNTSITYFFGLLDNNTQFNNLVTITQRIDSSPLFNEPTTLGINTRELESLLFYRSKLFSQLCNLIPEDYGWFSRDAITKGNLSHILRSLGNIVSLYYVKLFSLLNIYKSYRKERYLDDLAQLRDIPRIAQENSDVYQDYVNYTLYNATNGVTSFGIINSLKRIGIGATIENGHPYIFVYNSFRDSIFNPYVDVGYYHGNTYASSNLIHLNVYYPLNDNIYPIIDNLTVEGVSILYTQDIQLSTVLIDPTTSCLKVTLTPIPDPTCRIELEDGSGYVEDEDTTNTLGSASNVYVEVENAANCGITVPTTCRISLEDGSGDVEDEASDYLEVESTSVCYTPPPPPPPPTYHILDEVSEPITDELNNNIDTEDAP